MGRSKTRARSAIEAALYWRPEVGLYEDSALVDF